MAEQLKVFISSPGDVGQERFIATRVIERLNGEFSRYFEITPYLWEHEPLRASAHFQEQITLPSETNIVVFILWSRLGTRLPENIKRPDGSYYSSGTEFEFENALEAFKEKGLPDLLVYRKIQDPNFNVSNESIMLEKLEQKKALDLFVEKWFGSATTGFKAAFHAFNAPDEFEGVLEEHLRRLIRDKIPEIPVSIPVKRWYQNPFRGLETFEYDHAPIFFGRTKAIGEIIEKMIPATSNSLPFTIVYGMSGCGKSSLVKAGVIPVLTQPGVIEGIGLWRRASFRPGDSPEDLLSGLMNALTQNTALPELLHDGSSIGELIAFLKSNSTEVVNRIISVLHKISIIEQGKYNLTAIPESRLVLLVDQLEELFTFEKTDQKERESFVDVLSAILGSGKVWIIATMRSDFYHRCAELPLLVRISEGREYRLLNPEFTEIGQIIRNPAIAAGLSFEINPNTGERLDDIIHGAASKDTASLPLLEFTLTELFKERIPNNNGEEILTIKSYHALGGLEGALAKRAEDVYNSLSDDVKGVFPSVFRTLVTADAQENKIITNKRVPYDALVTSEKNKQLIDAFVKERLIVSDRDSNGQIVIRIAHEAMLYCWPRLKALLEEALEFLRIRKHISDSTELWKSEGKKIDFLLQQGKPLAEAEDILKKYHEELSAEIIEFIKASIKRARKSRMIRGLAIAAAFIVVLAFSIVTFYQLQEVRRQKQMATEGQIELMIAASENATSEGDRIRGMRLGLEAYNLLITGIDREDLLENTKGALYKTLHKKPYSSFGLLKGHYGSLKSVQYSPDGEYIVSNSADRTVKVWDAHQLTELYTVEPGWEYIDEILFNNDGSMFLMASVDKNQVMVYETRSGKQISNIRLNVDAAPLFRNFAFFPDNERIYAFRGHYKQIYDIKTGKMIKDLGIKVNGEDASVLSPDGKTIVSSETNKELYVGDPQTGEVIKALPGTESYRDLAFSTDGQYFICNLGPKIQIWRTSDWSLVRAFTEEKFDPLNPVSRVALHPSGSKVLIAYQNAGLRIYDISSGALAAQIQRNEDAIEYADFNQDGSLFYIKYANQSVAVFNTEDGARVATLSEEGVTPLAVDFSPDNKFIACGFDDYIIRVYTVEGPTSYEKTELFEGDIVHQLPMPNSKDAAPFILETFQGGMMVQPSESNDAEPVSFSTDHTYGDHYANPYPMFSYSPDGRYIAVAYPDGFVEVFDHQKKTSTPAMTFSNTLYEPVNSCYFSFDSNLLLTSSYGGKATIYDIQGKKILHELRGHKGGIRTAEFSLDNTLVYTLGSDASLRVWSVATGNELFKFDGLDPGNFKDAGFDPEFENILVLMNDGSALKARIFPETEALADFCEKIIGE